MIFINMNISNIILEEIIRGYIVEQRQKKAIVSKLSRSQQRLMKSAGGINGFDLKITYAGIKPTTFSTTDLARLIDATGTTNVGRNSNFDKRDPKNGNNPAFVYVVSKDVSSNRQTAKFNVWIMHYAPLAVLSDKIADAQQKDSTNSGEDIIHVEGEMFGDIGSIRVVNDSDFTKYINTLKTLSTKYSLQLTDNNKQIAWPNVTAINTQSADDAESDATTDATTQSKEFSIKNGNFEELATFLNKPISDIKEQLAHLDVIKFSGTVKYIPNTKTVQLQNAFTIVASQGSCQVEVDGVPGFFEGSFKDNLPAIGTYTPIINGQPVTGEWDAEEGYTASGDAVKLKLIKQINTTTSTIQISDNAEKLSDGGKSTGVYPTLYSPNNWKNVYTYVNGKWYYASKEQFNSNSVSSVGEVTEQKVLDYLLTDQSSVDLKTAQSDWKIDDPVKLFKDTGLTFPVPKNTSNTVSKDKTKDKSKSKIISTAFKPGSTYKSIGKLIPLYKFINKETGFKQFNQYEPDPPNEAFKIQSLSSDKKYAYGRFIADQDNDTYWIKVSNLKK